MYIKGTIMIRRKTNKFESYDVHADVYNWFNKYCDNIQKSGNDLAFELEGIDDAELAQQAIDELSLDDSYIDLVDADLLDFIEDKLDEINNDHIDTSFNKNNSDWLDKYNNMADYSASLESYKKENNMIRRKLTLEQRINRLEKLLSSNRRSYKFEGLDSHDPWGLSQLKRMILKAARGYASPREVQVIFNDSGATVICNNEYFDDDQYKVTPVGDGTFNLYDDEMIPMLKNASLKDIAAEIGDSCIASVEDL